MTVSRLQPYAVTVFAEMSALAARIGAVNLGQGFPDEDGPPAMLKTAENAIAEGVNQYPPGMGIAPLREAIAAQRRRHFGIEYNPDTEVLVTVGATEAIAATVIGLVEPGSEVILIEPFYDSYSPVIAMAGAHRVTVPLVPDGRGFAIDVDALRRAITPKTKALIINSPHNPTGMVLSDDELSAVARIAVDADLLVITDEVYEHLVFDNRRHLPLAGYPGMAQRTDHHLQRGQDVQLHGLEDRLGVRSPRPDRRGAGGQAIPQLCRRCAVSARGGPGAQHRGRSGWPRCGMSLQAKRDRLAAALTSSASTCTTAADTYFLCADPRPLGYHDSTAFCAELPERAGVAAIPMSAFCDPGAAHADAWNHLVRFAFCKRDDTMDEAIRRLQVLRG